MSRVKQLRATGKYVSSLWCADGQDYNLLQKSPFFQTQYHSLGEEFSEHWKISSPSVCHCLILKYCEHHVQGFSSETNFPLGQTKTPIIETIIIKYLRNLSQAFDIVLVLTYFISAINKANKATTWK